MKVLTPAARRLIGIGVAADLGVDGAGGAVQGVLAHAGGGDVAEVRELGVGQVLVVLAVVRALELVDEHSS